MIRRLMRRGVAPAGLILLGWWALGGCYVETRRHSTWDDFAERMADAGHRVRVGGQAATRSGPPVPAQRAVRIATLTGNAAEVDAQMLVTRLRSLHRLPAVWVQRRNDAQGRRVAVFAGRFHGGGDERAQRAMLKRVQRLEEEGERPYRDAELIDLEAGAAFAEDLHPNDFRNHAGRYALQVGHYTDAAPGGRHAAAEARTAELIDAGHRSMFFHGPRMSVVVIGLFDESDFVQVAASGGGGFTEQAYGPDMLKLQEAFPHNLRNGEVHLVRPLNGGSPVPQASRMVRSRR